MEMIEGDLPRKAIKLVQEWGESYKDDLQEMWDSKQLKKLPPLE